MHIITLITALTVNLMSAQDSAHTVRHIYTLRLDPVAITCDLDRRVCTGTIDAKTFDPHVQICIGNVCAGCTDGGDDPDNTGFYLQCYISVGDATCGITCTSNDGWHCIDECF